MTLSVNVGSSNGMIPTGTVSFMDGINIVQADVVLNTAGEATWTSNNLTLGTHEITVHYSGDTLLQAIQLFSIKRLFLLQMKKLLMLTLRHS